MAFLFKTLTLAFLISLFLLAGGLVTFFVSAYAVQPEKPGMRTDAIIVLTGGNYRVQTGLGLWSEHLAQELFITGVNRDVKRREILAEWKGEEALPHCCITLGYEATTTHENAIEAKDWVERNNIKTARIVTSPYHMQRALLEFRQAMPDLVMIAHPVQMEDYTPRELVYWKILFSEYIKAIWRGAHMLSGMDAPA